MTLWQFRSNLKRLSSRLIIVDSEGHEVFNNNLGIYVHWIKKDIYDGRTIDYISVEDDNLYIIYLED